MILTQVKGDSKAIQKQFENDLKAIWPLVAIFGAVFASLDQCGATFCIFLVILALLAIFENF